MQIITGFKRNFPNESINKFELLNSTDIYLIPILFMRFTFRYDIHDIHDIYGNANFFMLFHSSKIYIQPVTDSLIFVTISRTNANC